MRTPQSLEEDYRELELEPGASLQEVKNSYRQLALFWHPDQFHTQPGRLAKAHQKMTRINLAYERIRIALARAPHPRTASPRPHTSDKPREERSHPREVQTNSLGMRFVAIPGTPVLFSIWETRVADYRAYAETVTGADVSWKTPSFAQTATHPVVNVSWNDAKRFCVWLTQKELREGKLPVGFQYRLPTDSEWSWAVGIGDRERPGSPKERGNRLKDQYPWGTKWPPPKGAGNYHPSLGTDAFEHTSPVGSFAANPQGLFDLGGNVWEWCEDFLHGTSGPRVLRGASWNFVGAGHLLSSYRNGVLSDARSSAIGFRCVLAARSQR
jgi:hypothetical protein